MIHCETVCDLTYDLAFTKYREYLGTTELEADMVFNYLKFEVNLVQGGGPLQLLGKDYLPLPSSTEPLQNVQKIAEKGTNELGF